MERRMQQLPFTFALDRCCRRFTLATTLDGDGGHFVCSRDRYTGNEAHSHRVCHHRPLPTLISPPSTRRLDSTLVRRPYFVLFLVVHPPHPSGPQVLGNLQIHRRYL